MIELPQHATLSASSAHRWRPCPGSVRMEAGLPDTSGHAADVGTAGHEIAANVLRGEMTLDAIDAITTWQGEDLDAPVAIDEEMRRRIRVYVEEIRARHTELGGTLHIETRFSLERLNPPDPMYGTCDAAIVVPVARHIDINDFKSGYTPVDPVENDQLMYYALGAVLELWPADTPPPETITVRIIQPAHDPAVQEWTFGWDTLVQFRKDLIADAEAALKPDAPLVPGEKQCKWCKAKAFCPALRDYAMAVAGDEFAAVPVPVATEESLPAPGELGNDELNELLDRAEMFESFVSALREERDRRVLAGTKLPGWKIVERTTHRKWEDEDEVEKWFRNNNVLVREFTSTKLISPAQAESLCREKNLEFPEGLAFKPKGSEIVVREDDSRAEVARGSEFTALPATTEENNE